MKSERIFRKNIDGSRTLIRHLIDGVEQPIPGLGDKITSVAEPIVKAMDKVAGTKLADCGSCKKMRERLNAGMSIQEAAKMRVIEFALKKLARQRTNILSTVDTRLKAKSK
jgi:hypothetical protein